MELMHAAWEYRQSGTQGWLLGVIKIKIILIYANDSFVHSVLTPCPFRKREGCARMGLCA